MSQSSITKQLLFFCTLLCFGASSAYAQPVTLSYACGQGNLTTSATTELSFKGSCSDNVQAKSRCEAECLAEISRIEKEASKPPSCEPDFDSELRCQPFAETGGSFEINSLLSPVVRLETEQQASDCNFHCKCEAILPVARGCKQYPSHPPETDSSLTEEELLSLSCWSLDEILAGPDVNLQSKELELMVRRAKVSDTYLGEMDLIESGPSRFSREARQPGASGMAIYTRKNATPNSWAGKGGMKGLLHKLGEIPGDSLRVGGGTRWQWDGYSFQSEVVICASWSF